MSAISQAMSWTRRKRRGSLTSTGATSPPGCPNPKSSAIATILWFRVGSPSKGGWSDALDLSGRSPQDQEGQDGGSEAPVGACRQPGAQTRADGRTRDP